MRNITYNGVELTVARDKQEMSDIATDIILERIRGVGEVNILVPTGTTPELVYEKLGGEKDHSIFGGTQFFNMDEYGYLEDGEFKFIDEDHPASYRLYMKEKLFSKLGNTIEKNFPGTQNVKSPGRYDYHIEAEGGIDLCINAIGEDGHTFGFNSPPDSELDSQTRLVELNNDTQQVNEKLTGIQTPTHAITVGLATGMASKEILMLVCEERKAQILKRILDSDKPTMEIPATILKTHKNCRWIIDEEAAQLLSDSL